MIWFLILLLLLTVLTLITVTLLRACHRHEDRPHQNAQQVNKEELAQLEENYQQGHVSKESFEQTRREFYERVRHTQQTPDIQWRIAHPRRIWIGLCIFLPLLSVGLYLMNGHPTLPPQPLKEVLAEHAAENEKTDTLIHRIRIVQEKFPLDPAVQRQGDVLLGNLEMSQGRYDGAIADFMKVLDMQFDPQLAAQIAEIMCMRDHHVNQQALQLFREALQNAPANAPWRKPVMARIAQGEHEEENP